MKGNVQLTNEEYHSKKEYISKSGLDAAAKSGVHWLDYKEGKKAAPTAALRVGSAFHALILEPDVFENEFIYKPETTTKTWLLTKEGKAWKQDQEDAGRTVLTLEEKEHLQRMSKSLLECPPAKKLLAAAGKSEQSYFWEDKETGLGCKCRPDYIFDDGSTIVDLKTTTDASYRGFLRSISNFRYHVQAGWYTHGLEQATGVRPERFIFIAVEKLPPYGVGVYQADLYMTVNGYDQAKIDLKKIAKWEKEGVYPNYCTDIQQISLPSWMTGAGKGETPSTIADIALF